MSPTDFAGMASIVFGFLTLVLGLFVGVAIANRDDRLKSIKLLHTMHFGRKRLELLAQVWTHAFEKMFGTGYFAKRQLFTIPLYTAAVASFFFATWIGCLYLFRNPEHSFSAPLPLLVKQALLAYCAHGFFISMGIDAVAIFMTKFAIGIGRRRCYVSMPFMLALGGSCLAGVLLFLTATFMLRVADMVGVYIHFVPNDPMPIVPIEPLRWLRGSLNLFEPETVIYVTSRGFISTYFMPQPVLLYGALSAQATLVLMAVLHLLIGGGQAIKTSLLWLFRTIGTPKANVYATLTFLSVLLLAGFPLVGFVVRWIWTAAKP